MNAKTETHSTVSVEVLIIGAGAAGLRTAIELAFHKVNCLVVGKRKHGDAHTRWAAGGINASFGSLDPQDRWEIHAADTLREGHFICQPDAVELLARNAPERVRELAAWGCDFDLTSEGKINQRYFGAQSFRRTCFVGDCTGEAILQTLVRKARSLQIPFRENIFITKLLTRDGAICGAAAFDLASGARIVFHTPLIVLAAAGCTSLYKRSSSREDENTGDAAALAFEAGAVLRDMEFIQFHPTGMIQPPEMKGRLVTEAVRGEGGRLVNRLGERFMERYSPQRLELDARDLVARANYEEIQSGRGTPAGGVFLDISHQDPGYIRERLPRIYERFQQLGIDITREPMEVAPTAHYAMGGIKVHFATGATSLPGLFAVGEATSGLHGANRLGGNSLAETIVFGQITGLHLADQVPRAQPQPLESESVRKHFQHLDKLPGLRGHYQVETLIAEIRELLWDHAGIVRTAEGLRQGLVRWQEVLRNSHDLQTAPDLRDLEWSCNLQFMLRAAEAILKGALARAESRGAHCRKDFPGENPGWRKNILYFKEDGEMKIRTEPLPPLARGIEKALMEEHRVDYHHLE
jgi:succinate dehydrogenase / fumarate reductase, flavoprotein subunit